MTRGIPGSLVLAAAMLTTLMTGVTGGAAWPPAADGYTATYDFYLGGIWAGKMTFDVDFGGDADGGTYRVGLAARTAGIVGLFIRAGAEAEAVGRVEAAGPSPLRFAADTYEFGRRRLVEIAYADGSPTVVAEPAYRLRPWSISARDQRGISDPLSAALEALAPVPAEALCRRTANVFDGQRRWAVEIGPPRQEGGRIRCDAVYVRIGGFKPALMGARARRPLALFFEDRGDGLFHAVRAAGETSFGLAVLLLRK
ncbi:MAG: DUF3108 domain-containing protein [Paracoccaceae bacterium]